MTIANNYAVCIALQTLSSTDGAFLYGEPFVPEGVRHLEEHTEASRMVL